MEIGTEFPEPAERAESVPAERRERARQLVREAREALADGNINEARRKALSASGLNVTFGVFEDRPEAILVEIAGLSHVRSSSALTDRRIVPVAPAQPDVAVAAEGRAKAVAGVDREGTPEIQITPGSNRNALPDTGLRLTFDFHSAPWDFVLTQFATKVGLPLDMPLVPAGELTYVDHQSHSPQETLNTLNVLLIEKGFTLIHRKGRLILKAQPSAISSRTVTQQSAESEPANPTGDSGMPATIVSTPRQRSENLLSDARIDLSHGRIEEARRKAATASRLNVTYGLFDDRPEAVLEEVQRTSPPTQPMPQSQTPTPVPATPVLNAPEPEPPASVGNQMSFSFQEASWEFVLREYAKVVGLPLDMPEIPSGTFTHSDSRLFTPEETLEVLNQFLSRTGFRMVQEAGRLTVRRIQPVLRKLR